MTGYERVKRIINHKEADRVPKYDAFWEDTLINYYSDGLQKNLDLDNKKLILGDKTRTIGNSINDYFGFDIDILFLDNSMRWETMVHEETDEYKIVTDRCGYTAKKLKHKSNTMLFLNHVNKTQDDWQKLNHRFSIDPKDSARIDNEPFFLKTSDAPSWNEVKVIFDEYKKRNNFILFNGYGPYEGTWRHHGFTESLMDIACEKEYMQDMFETITNLTIEVLQYAINYGIKPDGFYMVEDLGYTGSTLFSPELYKELLWPSHRKLGDFLHSKQINFFIHSCGKISTLLPYFIEAGIDVVQPLQANTGMDIRHLKGLYKNNLTFWGNIDVMKLSGSYSDIEEEIKSKITIAMKDGGYIYHSDHSVPPSVSLDKYRYAMKMLDRYGKY
jgi:uroporphyrinogen decarboxylase